MSRWICSVAAAAFPFFAVAFVPGENILANGSFRPDRDGCLPIVVCKVFCRCGERKRILEQTNHRLLFI